MKPANPYFDNGPLAACVNYVMSVMVYCMVKDCLQSVIHWGPILKVMIIWVRNEKIEENHLHAKMDK